MDHPFSKLEKQFKEIPPDVRKAISSTHVGEKLMQIGRKYNLHVDTLDKLFGETGFVMLGLTHPKDYTKKISKELRVNEKTAREIAAEVNELIYRPIKESLKKMYSMQQNAPGASVEETSAHERTATPPSNLPTKADVEKDAPGQGPPVSVQKSEPSLPRELVREQVQAGHESTQTPLAQHQRDENFEREQVLKELEKSEEIAGEPPKDLLEKKMTATFKNPKEKSEYIGAPEKDSGGQGKQPDKVDPYREPPE